jgi:hypothetical protein
LGRFVDALRDDENDKFVEGIADDMVAAFGQHLTEQIQQITLAIIEEEACRANGGEKGHGVSTAYAQQETGVYGMPLGEKQSQRKWSETPTEEEEEEAKEKKKAKPPDNPEVKAAVDHAAGCIRQVFGDKKACSLTVPHGGVLPEAVRRFFNELKPRAELYNTALAVVKQLVQLWRALFPEYKRNAVVPFAAQALDAELSERFILQAARGAETAGN